VGVGNQAALELRAGIGLCRAAEKQKAWWSGASQAINRLRLRGLDPRPSIAKTAGHDDARISVPHRLLASLLACIKHPALAPRHVRFYCDSR
jgi:hypothetical protein